MQSGRRREHAQYVTSLKIYFRPRLRAVASRILKSLFSEDGDYLDKFKLQERYHLICFPKIAFHQLTESVVIARLKKEELVVGVEIFTKDGEFVRRTQIHEERLRDIIGMTVTRDGRIALLLSDINGKFKVLVI